MKQPRSAVLLVEVQRYLALVDLFRAEGYEPHWRDAYGVCADGAPTAVQARDRERRQQ